MVNPLKGSIILIFRLKKGFSSFSSEPWHISKCFYTHTRTHAHTHTHSCMHTLQVLRKECQSKITADLTLDLWTQV